jgi:hypothetical protein
VIILSKLGLQGARRGRTNGQKTKLQFFNTYFMLKDFGEK